MDRLNRISKIQFGLMTTYFFTLFMPIYKFRLPMTTASISATISQLNAGLFYV